MDRYNEINIKISWTDDLSVVHMKANVVTESSSLLNFHFRYCDFVVTL